MADKLSRELRFKLELMASKHGVAVRGYSVFEIVRKISAASNLTDKEKEILRKIGKYFGEDISDLWRKK